MHLLFACAGACPVSIGLFDKPGGANWFNPGSSPDVGDGLAVDIELESYEIAASTLSFFRVLKMQPSRANKVFIHPGARQSLGSKMIVALLYPIGQCVCEGEYLIHSAHRAVQETSDTVVFFDLFRANRQKRGSLS